MPINIFLLRGEEERGGLGQADVVRESEKMRGKKCKWQGVERPRVEMIDVVIDLDSQWRKGQFNMEQAKKKVEIYFTG